eukprot:12710634-Heterocapsa_arctica.AAC.1
MAVSIEGLTVGHPHDHQVLGEEHKPITAYPRPGKMPLLPVTASPPSYLFSIVRRHLNKLLLQPVKSVPWRRMPILGEGSRCSHGAEGC